MTNQREVSPARRLNLNTDEDPLYLNVDMPELADHARKLAAGMASVFESPNELDRNGEAANVVDGLFAIARAIHHLAQAHEAARTDEEHDDYHAARRNSRDVLGDYLVPLNARER